jgi:hypothetical protein
MIVRLYKERRFFVQCLASIREVKIRETASSDKEVRVVLITEDTTAVELQKYIGEEVVKVEVK